MRFVKDDVGIMIMISLRLFFGERTESRKEERRSEGKEQREPRWTLKSTKIVETQALH